MTRRRIVVAVTAVAITVVVAVPAWAYLDATTQTPLALAVATLAVPGASVTVEGLDAVITPIAPLVGPAPSSYSVGLVTDGGLVAVCASISPASSCVDPGAAAPGAAGPSPRYVVTAHLGRLWTRDAEPVGLPAPLVPVTGGGPPGVGMVNVGVGAVPGSPAGDGKTGTARTGDGTGPQGGAGVERERPAPDGVPAPRATSGLPGSSGAPISGHSGPDAPVPGTATPDGPPSATPSADPAP